ncbi:MAG: site-specific integrase [bacterium]
MLEKYFVKPATVHRIRACWLGAHIDRYVAWMSDHRYRPTSVMRRVRVAYCFAEFAKQRGAVDIAAALPFIDAFVAQWLKDHGATATSVRARRCIEKDALAPVRQIIDIAQGHPVIRHRAKKAFPFMDEAPGFPTYLRDERGLREATIRHYAHYLNAFGDFCQRRGAHRLSALSPALLAAYVVDRCPHLSYSGRRDLCGSVRVFLRYCRREQLIDVDLSAAIEMPQSFRLSDVPRAIGWDDVRRMLAVVDRRTPKGRRDYAILLLLVTYGLRGHEVANLCLDDIDWKREQLRIPDRKAGHCTAYPLAVVVGEAILDYLRNGRPQGADRHVFFRAVAPCIPITSAAISSFVSLYLQQSGVRIHRAGSHTLRHTCVQRLIDAEFPLKTIGDYVGHRSPDSTAIYTKVALESLREVAMGDGEAL